MSHALLHLLFFYQGFLSRTLTIHRTAEEGGVDHLLFHSTTWTHSRTFRYSFATLHVRWDDYHIFLITTLCLPDCYSMRFTTLSNYYLSDWWCDVDFLLFNCWFPFRFCYNYLTWEVGGLKFALTIILVLQECVSVLCMG